MNRIIDSARKATESSVAMQQELFRKWASLWPGAPVSAIPFGELQKFQKKWVEMVGELFQRENDILAVQFKTGFGAIEKLCRLAEAKDGEQLRTKTVELWQKTFDNLCLMSHAQLRGFQNAVAKMAEVTHTEHKAPEPSFPVTVINATKPKETATVRTPRKPRSDREELKEAMEEYEMTKGDWSKGR
jgi:hypothetical protein